MGDSYELGPLPNGWECKFDVRTGRNYFINYLNKTTTWDDPRVKSSMNPPPYPESTELIPLQVLQPQLHGSPDLRNIYPSCPPYYHPQPAFQMPNPYMQEMQRQEVINMRSSPVPSRAYTAPLMGSHAIHHNSKIQETSLSSASATEQSVAKLSAMFPTVSETHIRALLIKYHSREAVVISALQVEKNPLTTPGPFSTPPLARHIIVPPPLSPPNYHSTMQSTPPLGFRDCYSTTPSLYSCGVITAGGTLTGSPASSSYLGSPACRHSPRPHSSPKMKLRYMKSMFPKADETIILDTLYNVDNNVQAATNQLQEMGFGKRDTSLSRAGTPLHKVAEEEKQPEDEEIKEKRAPTPVTPPKMKSLEEKQQICSRVKEKHPDLVEQLITMALESVDYDEEKAGHILDLMVQEEITPQSTHPNSAGSTRKPDSHKSDDEEVLSLATKTTVEADVFVASSAQSNNSGRPSCSQHRENGANQVCNSEGTTRSGDRSNVRKVRGRKDTPKVSRGTSTTEDKEYRSPFRLIPLGPDPAFHRGPNDELLLEDYVTWTGPALDMRTDLHSCTAKGSNRSLLRSREYMAKGANKDLCQGPKKGLAKGSIYSHLTAAAI